MLDLFLSASLPVQVALTALLLCVGAGVAFLAAILRRATATPRAPTYDTEGFFTDEHGKEHAFPSPSDAASVTLTVVVPAYNEAERLPPMMTDMIAQCERMAAADSEFTWEILIVNDGSKDATPAVVMERYVKKHTSQRIRLLNLYRNNGKGGAVRKGMVRARGRYVLMADADGATSAADTSVLLDRLKKTQRDGLGIAIGSRAHMEEDDADAKAVRSPFRKFLMWGFHTLINIAMGSSEIRDTQCGFKMFTRAAAARIFPVQHIDRWAFDVEVLFLAQKFGIPMVEVPVNWHEIDGSKLDVLSSTIQMARDILAIRLSYTLGIWKALPDTTPIIATRRTAESKKTA